LSGLRAAALAGLGITPQAQGFIPDGLEAMPESSLPPLGSVEFVVRTQRRTKRGPAIELAQAITAQGGRLRP